MTSYQWNPTADYIEQANVTRLARMHGLAGIDELRARSVADTAWYWDAAATDLGLRFRTPYSRVVDLSKGIEHPDWFVDATLNIVDSCLLRWRDETPDRIAVVHEDESGRIREITFSQLATEVARAANGLRELGIGPGDAVAIYLPMIPEAVVACYAVAALGATLVPLFSGFASSAIASRLADAEAKAVIVADVTIRRGRTLPLLPQVSAALAQCPTVRHVIVVPNGSDHPPEYVGAQMVLWSQLTYHDAPLAPVGVAAMHPLLLGYTSGTTGRPKGAVHTHAGFLVKTASEVAYSFDVKPGGVFSWVTDMGWIMGPLSVFGTHANGATLLLYEGSPDRPDSTRLWQLVERHRVTMLGVSPTLVRALRSSDPSQRPTADLSSVHVLGSTGEPWDPGSYDWLARDVFGGCVPVINFSGGTEVGGSFLAPYPVEPIRSCSLGGPSLGMDVDVVDDTGRSVRGQVGELVCRQPWPSMTRGIWNDDERYLQAYWSHFPGIWTHGDFAMVDGDGQWFILGRSDDVMNVAGKRLAPAEVESVMITHPRVAEAAAVGVPDTVKGEAVWAFWVSRGDDGNDETADQIATELAALVGRELGKPFTPSRVWRVAALPKTRSAKIMRRAIRAAALGIDPGDLSGAENPDAVTAIRDLVADEALSRRR
ncbi:AMP-binding protein [Mycobacterium sp. AZCC_0083]|uniref:AMP-binding protein n=1 Tax=Mycobacterium sp. AZCC_0083 TaxID=2735882 RepID=UPI0016098167|nr:AMP-binding protein [Mycobacterium sp. AZCC_0083]MBB5163079.1 acetyl-CoA synthetase [Mycobacterium sp. AZCC_0083]